MLLGPRVTIPQIHWLLSSVASPFCEFRHDRRQSNFEKTRNMLTGERK